MDEVDNDTILFVFGDHGMTATGEHGGESQDETDAALFVYSPRPLFCNRQMRNRVVCQIDLVPTTAMLLGIPLPFSNLGAIIPELFLPCSTDSPPPDVVEQMHESDGDARTVYEGSMTLDFLTALHLNAKQIETYLSAYSLVSGDFSSLELRDLQRTLSQAELTHAELATLHERQKYSGDTGRLPNSTKMADTARLYVKYLQDVKEMCRQIWAKFEDSAIHWGVFVVFLSSIVTLALSLSSDTGSYTYELATEQVQFKHVCSGLLLGLVGSVLFKWVMDSSALSQGWVDGAEVLVGGTTCGALLGMLYSARAAVCSACLQLTKGYLTWTSNLHTLVSFALAIVYALSLLGSSCILYEFSVAIFLSQTLVALTLVYSLRFSVVRSRHDWFRSRAPFFRRDAFFLFSPKGAVLASVFAMVVNRVSKAFRTCRHFQVDCSLTHYTMSLAAAMETLGNLSVLRFAVTCAGVCVVPLVVAVWLRRTVGPLGREQRTCLLLIHPLVSVLVCGHWAVQGYAVMYADQPLPAWQHVLLPWLVYLLVVTSVGVNVVLLLRGPSPAVGRRCDLERVDVGNQPLAPVCGGVRRRGEYPKQEVKSGVLEKPSSDRQLRGVVVLGAWLQVVLGVWQVLVMLHNDGLALGAVLMAAQMGGLLLLTATSWGCQEGGWDGMCHVRHVVSQCILFTASHAVRLMYHCHSCVCVCMHVCNLILPSAAVRPRLEAGVAPSTWPTAVYWSVVTTLFFHATGHETTIPSIKFDAAFVGIHGEVDSLPTFLLAGLLVGLNTLGSQVRGNPHVYHITVT